MVDVVAEESNERDGRRPMVGLGSRATPPSRIGSLMIINLNRSRFGILLIASTCTSLSSHCMSKQLQMLEIT